MRLYNVKRRSFFTVTSPPEDIMVAPGEPEPNVQQQFQLGSLDGMYSWSTGEDGERYHFSAWTEVEVVNESVSI